VSNEKLVLIDGHALAYRAYFALPLESFTTKSGEPTNATYGFTRTLLDLMLADGPPKYLAVSFDVGATFRDEIFGAYKGTREKMPDELEVQIDRIRQVVNALNIPILERPGYEADDVLGTISRQAKELGVPVHIITGDRDLLQLVDENTIVELPPGQRQREPQLFDSAAVLQTFEIEPKQIVDWKALMGDTSDNIPGVAGIGVKTATQLIRQYGSLDEIYAHLDEIPARFRAKLAEGREAAYMSQKLARIVTDAPVTLDLEACLTHEFDAQKVLGLFQELEFRSLSNRLARDSGQRSSTPEEPPTSAITVRTLDQLQALVKTLAAAKVIGFDVETTSLDTMQARLVGICLAVAPPTSYYIPVGHLAEEGAPAEMQMSLFAGQEQLAEGQLPLVDVIKAIGPALTDSAIEKVGHNAKYDFSVLKRHGLRVTPIAFDTMIAEWLCDPSSKFKGLKGLAGHRLGVQMTDIGELIGRGAKQRSFAAVPIEEAAPYGAADADMTLRLVAPLKEELERKGLTKLLRLEMELMPVLADMEEFGVGLDKEFFEQLAGEMHERLVGLERQIYSIAGHPFNINSTQQLSDVLFKELQLPHERLRKTSSGYFSTAAEVLESLKASDETGIIDQLLEYRELGKLKGTYVDALPGMINDETGRIHTRFNQTGAVTGRIASEAPNLQNIPIRSEEGRRIRRGFVSQPGWQFVAADYSQVELRVLAHVSQDQTLKESFWADQDIHRSTAAAVFGIPIGEVTFEQRRFAKAVNFGLMYGMGPYRLARESELTLAEAENYIKEYFARLPGVRDYLERTRLLARQQGYVETLLGRRRYFPVFQAAGGARNQEAIARAEREAINHPIQGTAADIIKLAMVELHRALESGYRARMILQVHDELLLEAPDDEVEAVVELVTRIMSSAFKLDVPLKVDASTGRNWLELKD
jgi:DNA polymerase-1